MIGFAARPGIDVDPMCSMRRAASAERRRDSALLDLEAAGPRRVVVGDHDAPDWLEPAHEHPIGILLPTHVASWLTAVASALVTHLSASTVTVDDIVDALDREGYCIVEGVLVARRGRAGEGLVAAGARRDPVRPERLRGPPHAARLRALREDARLRRRRDPPAAARRARPGARALSALGAHGHPDRSGREGAGAPLRRQRLPVAP